MHILSFTYIEFVTTTTALCLVLDLDWVEDAASMERGDELDILGICKEDTVRDKGAGMEDELEDAGARDDGTGMSIGDSDLGIDTKLVTAEDSEERTGDAGGETDTGSGETDTNGGETDVDSEETDTDGGETDMDSGETNADQEQWRGVGAETDSVKAGTLESYKSSPNGGNISKLVSTM